MTAAHRALCADSPPATITMLIKHKHKFILSQSRDERRSYLGKAEPPDFSFAFLEKTKWSQCHRNMSELLKVERRRLV